jgi:signal transduction histidine kinase
VRPYGKEMSKRNFEPEPNFAEACVLLVDDVAANLLALEAILEPLGCQLIRARSGPEALERSLQTECAVFLIDLIMPGMDGLETASLLRTRSATRRVPIIFITAHSDARRVMQSYATGAVDVLSKPLEPDIVRAKVAVFLELWLNRRELQKQAEEVTRHEREALRSRELYEFERLARTAAESARKAREEALAVVAHDLRSPMAAIEGTVTLLQRILANFERAPLAFEHLGRIRNSLTYMQRLVRDWLEVCRYEGGQIVLQKRATDARDLASQVLEHLKPAATLKRQKLVLDVESEPVLCDPDRTLQVLTNLIDNAIKFTPEDGSIHLRGTIEDGEFKFIVEDPGVGISTDDAERIFSPFWQAAAQAQSGMGLGLAIARSIVQAHGQRIWVESEPGAGSRFQFTLPRVDD